jgi:hypothetical protein
MKLDRKFCPYVGLKFSDKTNADIKFPKKLDFLDLRIKYERYSKIQYHEKEAFVLTETFRPTYEQNLRSKFSHLVFRSITCLDAEKTTPTQERRSKGPCPPDSESNRTFPVRVRFGSVELSKSEFGFGSVRLNF